MNQQRNKMVTRLLLLAMVVLGAALVVFLFFFIIPEESRTPKAWLNFGIILWMVVLTLGVFSLLGVKTKKNEEILPAFLTTGSIIFIYDILALILVFLTFVESLSFRFFVTGHVILGFLLFIGVIIAFIAINTARGVAAQEKVIVDNIKDIRSEVDMLTLKVDRLPEDFASVKEKFAAVKGEVRYISPNDTSQAQELEAKIKQQLAAFKDKLNVAAGNFDNGGDKENNIRQMENNLLDVNDLLTMRNKSYSS